MRILRHTDMDFASALTVLQRKSEPAPQVEKTVREIIAAIRARGDEALLEYTAKFGGPKIAPSQLRVTGRPQVDAATQRAVAAAHANVQAFATRSLRKSWMSRNKQGALVGERFDPFQPGNAYVVEAKRQVFKSGRGRAISRDQMQFATTHHKAAEICEAGF